MCIVPHSWFTVSLSQVLNFIQYPLFDHACTDKKLISLHKAGTILLFTLENGVFLQCALCTVSCLF